MGAGIHNHYTANMLICQEIFTVFAPMKQEKRKKIDFLSLKSGFRPRPTAVCRSMATAPEKNAKLVEDFFWKRGCNFKSFVV
jgi:hypothetical protein